MAGTRGIGSFENGVTATYVAGYQCLIDKRESYVKITVLKHYLSNAKNMVGYLRDSLNMPKKNWMLISILRKRQGVQFTFKQV